MSEKAHIPTGKKIPTASQHMPRQELYKTYRAYSHSGNGFSQVKSDLIEETPLEIIINNDRRVLIMFTPQMIRELVVGFVFTEGLIGDISDVEECVIQPIRKEDGEELIEAQVTLKPSERLPAFSASTRVSYSSCGICGTDNYYNLKQGLGRVKSRHRFSMEVLKRLPRKMLALQPLYVKTGGAHAALLFDAKGHEVVYSEDMGRHNALDKVIGSVLLNGIRTDDKILVSSGRSSLEMILKTARAGFPVFVAMSRPTSRAADAARFYNITLIDMAKGGNRIYSHARRIEGF